MEERSFVVTSGDPRSSDVRVVGGKASGLRWLSSQERVIVPAFATVAVAGYEAFIGGGDATAGLTRAQRRLESGVNDFVLHRVSSDVLAVLEAQPVPVDVTAQAAEVAAELGYPVAVRSSATTEDMTEHSAAGQFFSRLNVSTDAELSEAIHRCWMSAWTYESLRYRVANSLPIADLAVAVVLQRQVDAECAGVLFTSDPVARDGESMRLEASAGLGEALVGGQAVPELWAKGANGRPRREERADSDVLHDGQAAELFELGARLAAAAGRPLDIEWAWADGRPHLLQARAITGSRSDARRAAPRGVWVRSGFSEWFQRPLSPLFASAVLPRLEAATTEVLDEAMGLARPAKTYIVYDGYYYTSPLPRLSLSMFRLPAAAVHLLRQGTALWGTAEREQADALRVVRDGEDRPTDPQEAARSAWRAFGAIADADAKAWAWIVVTGGLAKTTAIAFSLVARVALRGSDPAPDALLSGFTNTSVEADQLLWEAAHASADAKDEDDRDALGSWRARHGHRILDLDPVYNTDEALEEQVAALVERYRATSESPAEAHERVAVRRERASASLARELRPWDPRGWVVKGALALATPFAQVRESRPNAMHRGWPPLREAALRLGESLQSAGVLDRADDVFFLRSEEVDGLLIAPWPPVSRSSVVASRRAEWMAQGLRRPLEHLNPWPGQAVVERVASAFRHDRDEIKGRAGSPGVATGRARLVEGPHDWSRMQPGDVLVTMLTTPAWTGLISLSTAVVTQEGGSLSHAAIVAREYGVPAVCGVRDLLDQIDDGDVIEVDGTHGTVRIVRHSAGSTWRQQP